MALGNFLTWVTAERSDPGCPQEQRWVRIGKIFYDPVAPECSVAMRGLPTAKMVRTRDGQALCHQAYANPPRRDESGEEIVHPPYLHGDLILLAERYTDQNGVKKIVRASYGYIQSQEQTLPPHDPFYKITFTVLPCVRARPDGLLWFKVALDSYQYEEGPWAKPTE